jgi:hypothetical protein
MEVSVSDVTDPLVPQPLDFTDADVLFQVRTGPTRNHALVFERSTDDGTLEIVDAGETIRTVGTPQIDLPAATYYAEMQATLADDSVITIYRGEWPHIDDIAV